MIRLLIVDDSPGFRAMLKRQLRRRPEIEVVGEAGDVDAAVRLVRELRPSIVSMDLVMPSGSGLDAISRIMSSAPVPVVVLSAAVSPQRQQQLMEATSVGAVALEAKPEGPGEREWDRLAELLVAMAGVKVLPHRRAKPHGPPRAPAAPRRVELVAVGASTGGPPALQRIISALPGTARVSVVIAQHLAHGFTSGLSSWLSRQSRLPVVVADRPVPLAQPAVILPADGHHLVVEDGRARPVPVDGSELAPSVDRLLLSVAEVYRDRAVGVVLTGMGEDGARGLKAMRDAGAMTLAQDQETSVVYGMPRAAAQAGAAQHVLPIDDIPRWLLSWVTA